MKARPGLFSRIWRAVYVALVGGWLVWVIATISPGEFSLADALRQPACWAFVVAWMVLALGLGVLWRQLILIRFGIALPWPVAIYAQSLAWAGRYLPGKAGLVLAKLTLAGRHGLDWRQIGYSVALEQMAFLGSGVLVALCFFPSSMLAHVLTGSMSAALTEHAELLRWLAVLVAVVGLAIGTAVAERVFGRQFATRPEWRGLIVLLLGYACLHVALGLAAYPLVAAALPESVARLGLWGVTGALALANVAGVLAVFAPGGLGVREGVLAMFLAVGELNAIPAALALAALLRLLTLVADVAVVGVGMIARSLWAPEFRSSDALCEPKDD